MQALLPSSRVLAPRCIYNDVVRLRDTRPCIWCLHKVLGNPCKCTSAIYNSALRGGAGPQSFRRVLRLDLKVNATQNGGLEAFVGGEQMLIHNFYHLRGKVGRTYPRFAGPASHSQRARRLLRTPGGTRQTGSEA